MPMTHEPTDWVIIDSDGYAIRLAYEEEIESGESDDGVVYRAEEPLPHCNDAQGWNDYRARQGYSGSHH